MSGVNRILSIARMQSRQWSLALIPWGIIAVVLGANVAILAIIRSQGVELPAEQYNGVVSSIFVFIAATYGVAVTQVFPFALSLGVTRREFFGGTLVAAAGHSVLTAAALTAMCAIEHATNGFGVHLRAFSTVEWVTGNYALIFLGLAVVLIACAGIGMLVGSIYLRWKIVGVFTLGLLLAIAGAAAAVLITWQRGWPVVGRFFTDTPVGLLIIAAPLALTVALFAGGYGLLRRAEV